jgi:hypothetical protein
MPTCRRAADVPVVRRDASRFASGWVSSQPYVFSRIFSTVRSFLRTRVSTSIVAAR